MRASKPLTTNVFFTALVGYAKRKSSRAREGSYICERSGGGTRAERYQLSATIANQTRAALIKQTLRSGW